MKVPMCVCRELGVREDRLVSVQDSKDFTEYGKDLVRTDLE